MRDNGVGMAAVRMQNIYYGLAVIVLCLLFVQSCYGQQILTCIADSGNTVFTDGACPAGYRRKGQDATTAHIIRKDITPSPVATSPQEFPWEKHDIVLKDIEMSWYLTRNSSQQKSILHPQVEFTVHNNGEIGVAGLKIIMIFVDDADKPFGDTSAYLKDIPAGRSSEETAMHPSMGFVYNGYDKDMITDKRYTVDIYGRYKGDKEKITTLDFFSKTIK
ncbi:MAG: hypothetical protein ACWGOX_08130 [Desulforhopalus sp.]